MRLAFCLDGYTAQVGVEVRQDDAGVVHGTVSGPAGTDIDAVRGQVARVLSLDHDGEEFTRIGERDPVIGRLQRVAPGLRPPLFYSPYEAAAWSVLSARRPAQQMMTVRQRLSEDHGAVFDLAGQQLAAFPTPEALLRVETLAGIPADKLSRLHGVAEAAIAGQLDAVHLMALGPDAAAAELQRIKGIGPFYSSLIVIRGTGFADVLPVAEPRRSLSPAWLYDLDGPVSAERFAELAEPWKPLRTWAVVLIRAAGPRLLGDEPTLPPGQRGRAAGTPGGRVTTRRQGRPAMDGVASQRHPEHRCPAPRPAQRWATAVDTAQAWHEVAAARRQEPPPGATWPPRGAVPAGVRVSRQHRIGTGDELHIRPRATPADQRRTPPDHFPPSSSWRRLSRLVRPVTACATGTGRAPRYRTRCRGRRCLLLTGWQRCPRPGCASRRVVVAVVRDSHIGEPGQRLAGDAGVRQAVGEHLDRRATTYSGSVGQARIGSSMVTTSSTILRPFGKPAGSPPSSPSMLTDFAGVGGTDVLSRSMSAWVAPVKLVKPFTMPSGSRSAGWPRYPPWLARLVELRQVREDPGIQDGQQPGQLGMGVVVGELLVMGGRLPVPAVLLVQRDDDLVDQRISQPRLERWEAAAAAAMTSPAKPPATSQQHAERDGQLSSMDLRRSTFPNLESFSHPFYSIMKRLRHSKSGEVAGGLPVIRPGPRVLPAPLPSLSGPRRSSDRSAGRVNWTTVKFRCLTVQ